jgi:hypothetical protein
MSITRGQESDDRAHCHSKTLMHGFPPITCGSCMILVRSGIVTLRSTMVHLGLALFNDWAERKPQAQGCRRAVENNATPLSIGSDP